MNEFQAAMGICNLHHLDEEIHKRKLVAERYRQLLSGVDGIKLIAEQENVQSNYAYFPVVFEGQTLTRDKVFELLREQNIFARKYFYPITSEFECYQTFPTADSSKTPIAKYVSEHILCLPLYADLALEDVDKICERIIDG